MQLFVQSLDYLQNGYIDLYQIHNVRLQSDLDAIYASNGAYKAFQELKNEGSVGFIGITDHKDPAILKKAIEQYDFDCILMMLNAADVHYLPFQYGLLDTAVKRNLGIIAMKVPSRGRIFLYDGITAMEQALGYVYSFLISNAIVGKDTLEQLEENVEITRNFQKHTATA